MRADKETICLSIQKKSIDRGRGDGEGEMERYPCRVNVAFAPWVFEAICQFWWILLQPSLSTNDANSDKVPSCLQEQKSDCRVHPVDEEGHLQNRLHVPNLAEQELEIISPSADGHCRTFVTSAALCSISLICSCIKPMQFTSAG